MSRLYYGWRMVGVVSAMRVLGGGLHGYGFTVFFLPVSLDLGLTRAQTSLAFSLARAEGAIEAPIIGYVVDRFGPRPLMVAAALLAGIGYISLSWVNSYVGFLIVYLGLSPWRIRPALSKRRWWWRITGSCASARGR
ncbi:MAG: MFS transporter [Candidatus Binatia bacterium]